jgi:hypothetical protein
MAEDKLILILTTLTIQRTTFKYRYSSGTLPVNRLHPHSQDIDTLATLVFLS